MEREATYRNITAAVRTPRFAVLVERNDLYWKAYMHGIIQSFSQTWGGEYFIIVPTDGSTIDDKFWEILEAYSPDKIGRYIPNLQDMQEAEPETYAKVKEHYRKSWKLEGDEFEETWAKQIKSGNIGGLEVSKELSEELKNRLSPFYFQDHVVGENVFHGSSLGFPFTDLEHIVEAAKDRPTKVTVPKTLDNEDFQLLAMSRTGDLSPEYLKKLKTKGFTEVILPDNSEAFRDKDYIEALEKGEYDTRWERALGEATGGEQPDGDFVRNMPFKLSMLHLGQFYRRDTHRDDKENLLVVVGNTMDDFCLYYCLSRLHEGVYWLPEQYLRQANRKHEANKNRGDEEIEKYTKHEYMVVGLVNEYFSIIRYGHDTKNIGLTSASLTARQLGIRRRWMAAISFNGSQEYLSHLFVMPLAELKITCVMRVIEMNNYANQQDMIFQDGKSVGRVNTPKPKNFNPINPAEHRWITTLEIDKYRPPMLPFLGSQIVGIRNMSNDTRVAKDGLAYLCPNVAYWNGQDIDVNTVRPELTLLDEQEMFGQYFADAGFATELSDKGSYLKDTINRFGSLEQVAAFFRNERKRHLLDQFLISKKDKDEKDHEVICLEVENRAYLSFEAFKRKLSGEEEAVMVIEELISKDILRRGFIFQCSRCRLAAWYDVALVGTGFTCARCDLKQPYTQTNWKMPAEPRWYYKLAETVYQFYKSSSHLTALALDKLRQEAPDEFHYVSETNIINPLDAHPKREIDILAIAKGNIILGECKDCPVTAADIRKYLTIFSELKIKPYQFLLATTEEGVTPRVQTELDKFKRHRLFTCKDLLE